MVEANGRSPKVYPALAVGTCLGPGCGSRKLVKAHIMPAGFARAMHLKGGHNLGLTEAGARRARLQHGAFDRGILCGDCDRHLGRLDEFALDHGFATHPAVREGTVGLIRNVDADRLAAFVTSVVWRASASTLFEFADVRLGPLEHRARDIAFGTLPPTYPVVANRLVSTVHDVLRFYVQPMREADRATIALFRRPARPRTRPLVQPPVHQCHPSNRIRPRSVAGMR